MIFLSSLFSSYQTLESAFDTFFPLVIVSNVSVRLLTRLDAVGTSNEAIRKTVDLVMLINAKKR